MLTIDRNGGFKARKAGRVGLVGDFKGEIMPRNFLGGRLLSSLISRFMGDGFPTKNGKGPVFVATRFLSPFHLNLVVVNAALFVIDFDDSCVIV